MANRRVVELDHISMQFQDKQKHTTDALQDVSLIINEGDFVCVLGPSGCGKSTMLNIIAGLLKPASGTASMLGEPIEGPDRHRAVVFQTPTLYPWLTTEENVGFGPKLRGIDKEATAARVKSALEEVGLAEFANTKPYELSGGMRQRAALARVLVNDPKLILMDEPFGALDALTRANMQQLVRTIWQEKHNTVLLITHDVDEALCLATRVIVMSPRPGRILAEYATDFTGKIETTDADEVRYLPEYIELRQRILSEIRR